MEKKKPLNFAQALRARPGERSQPPQLADADSHRPEGVDSRITPIAAIHRSEERDSSRASEVDSRNEDRPASAPMPAASRLAGENVTVARKRAAGREVASHQRQQADSRKGDRHSKHKLPFNNRLDGELVKRIKHFCVEHGLEQQEFAELSAIHFMEHVASHLEDGAASKLAPDDRRMMISYKTHPTIISLYLQYNSENRWKPADDRAAAKFNDVDPRIIEYAIISTQLNARFKRINSFQYFVPEIETALEVPLPPETLEPMLQVSRRRWEKARAEVKAE